MFRNLKISIFSNILTCFVKLEDEIKNDWTGEAILYAYESIQFEEKNDLKSVRFVKGKKIHS